MSLISDLIQYDDNTYRNIIGLGVDVEPAYFDDLSDDLNDCLEANHLAEENPTQPLTQEKLYFNAIDYVFRLKHWMNSRFGDGSFPVWYASTQLETTFHETVYHWRQSILFDANFHTRAEPIYSARTVFNVWCHSNLVDLRSKSTDYHFLVDPDTNQYKHTQKVGKELYSEGFPGLITGSARLSGAANIAMFYKKALDKPNLQGHYVYELLPGDKPQVNILNEERRETLYQIT